MVCAQKVRLAIGACPPGIVERDAFVRASFCLALWGCGCCNCASFGLAGAFCSGFLCLGLVEVLGFCWTFCFLGVFAWAAAAAAAAALYLCAVYLGAAHITTKFHAHVTVYVDIPLCWGGSFHHHGCKKCNVSHGRVLSRRHPRGQSFGRL